MRERTAVEHALAHLGHWQGDRARYIRIRKNLFDLRRLAIIHKLDNIVTLEGHLNRAFQSQIPPKVRKGRHRIAIDRHLIPYYGTLSEVTAPYLYRSQAKAGTTAFFAYAMVYVICRNKRVTLGIHAVHRQETLVATVTYLLAMLSLLHVRAKRLDLDRGFYSVPVMRWLKALNIPFLIPAVIRGKTGGTRQLLVGRKSYATRYTLTSANFGSATGQMRVVCTDYKSFKGKHGIQFALCVVHGVTVALYLRQRPHAFFSAIGADIQRWFAIAHRLDSSDRNPYRMRQLLKSCQNNCDKLRLLDLRLLREVADLGYKRPTACLWRLQCPSQRMTWRKFNTS